MRQHIGPTVNGDVYRCHADHSEEGANPGQQEKYAAFYFRSE